MRTRGIIAKDRFEEKGIALQENARTFDYALVQFDRSCTLCALYKRTADCETCPIREALRANVKWHGIKDANYYVQKEFAQD